MGNQAKHLLHNISLGVEIGFERTSYSVAEDADYVTICTDSEGDVGAEGDLHVEVTTVNGGKL
jgi:hypothetical protein